MSGSDFPRSFVLLSTLAASAYTDAKLHRVYNSLIMAGFAAVIAVRLIPESNIQPDYGSVFYLTAFILLMIFLRRYRMIGGADVKLYMLTAFTYQDSAGIRIIVLSLLLSGVYSLYLLAGRGLWKERVRHMKLYLAEGLSGAKTDYYDLKRDGDRAVIPMGVFIFAAAAAVLLLRV